MSDLSPACSRACSPSTPGHLVTLADDILGSKVKWHKAAFPVSEGKD